MRQIRIGRDHRVAQGLNDLWLDMVGQMARALRCGHIAPLIQNRLFFGLCVVHAGKGPDVLPEHAGDLVCGGLAFATVFVGKEIQCGFDVQLFAINLECEARDRFIKKTLPRVAHNAHIMQEPLKLI